MGDLFDKPGLIPVRKDAPRAAGILTGTQIAMIIEQI